MRRNRIYHPGSLIEGSDVALTGSAANHVARVLRLRTGDGIDVFDGKGSEHLATITAIKGSRVTARIGAAATVANESPLKITLTQGISRSERMDLVVQKAVELGVARIAPILTARSIVRLTEAQAIKKQEHWRNIAIAACEQCGRAQLPEIMAPTSFATHLDIGNTQTTRLILDPNATQSLQLAPGQTNLEILIGPEGGFEDTEVSAALQAGFAAVRFGPRILRTETAAIAVLAVLQAKWGDLV
jgi:16S rRNA (uracil1498-N3)-methyltransferase